MPETSTTPRSMRFALHEVLSGMLATIATDQFTDDAERMTAVIEDLAAQHSLFAPLAGAIDPAALSAALGVLESRNILQHTDGQYVLTVDGRAQCVGSKRTLFNQGDRTQLEEAARHFDAMQQGGSNRGA